MSSAQFWLILGITLLVGAILLWLLVLFMFIKIIKPLLKKMVSFMMLRARFILFSSIQSRRVGMYRTGKYEEEIKLNNKKVVVTFTISDFKNITTMVTQFTFSRSPKRRSRNIKN